MARCIMKLNNKQPTHRNVNQDSTLLCVMIFFEFYRFISLTESIMKLWSDETPNPEIKLSITTRQNELVFKINFKSYKEMLIASEKL